MPRPSRTPRCSYRTPAALRWMVATFVVVQLSLDLAIDSYPGLRDPEFGEKLARLQNQLAIHPGRPLLLIVGSSRSSSGIQPSVMWLPDPGDDGEPLVFNLALTGYGPIQQVQLLDRLLRTGISPRWILAEIHPLLLHQQAGVWGEEQWLRPESLDWRDLALVGKYLSQPDAWRWRWARLRTAPAYSYRFQILNYLSPGWLDTSLRQDGAWRDIDDLGWLPLVCSVDKQAVAERRRQAHRQYAPAFQDFRVTAAADQAVREFVELAAQRGIAVAFYLMPEGKAFRSWYSPAARQQIAAYLGALSGDTGVPIFDATSWCTEADFSDSHHLLADASAGFSLRFAHEIAGPFVAGNINAERDRPLRRARRVSHDQR